MENCFAGIVQPSRYEERCPSTWKNVVQVRRTHKVGEQITEMDVGPVSQTLLAPVPLQGRACFVSV